MICERVSLTMTDMLLVGVVLVDVVLLGGALGPVLVKVSQGILVRLFRGSVNGSMVVMIVV